MDVVRRALLGVSLLLVLASAALAGPRVKLTLEDGSVVEGELASFEREVYVVKIAGQRMELPARKVARVEFIPDEGAAPTPTPTPTPTSPPAPTPDRPVFDLSRAGGRRLAVGERVRVSKRTSMEAPLTEDKQKSFVLVDEVLAVDGEGRPTATLRTYEQIEGDHEELTGVPRSVRIEQRRDGGWVFTGPDGAPLPTGLERSLRREFEPDERWAAWRPGRPVRVGERWELSPEFLGVWFSSDDPDTPFEGAPRGEGTLEAVTHEDGHRWAVVALSGECTATISGRLCPTRVTRRLRMSLDGSRVDRDLSEVARLLVAGLTVTITEEWTTRPAAPALAAPAPRGPTHDLSKIGARYRRGDRVRCSSRSEGEAMGIRTREEVVYVDQVERADEGGRRRLVRTFERYVYDGEPLDVSGRSVRIERTGVVWTLTGVDGWTLPERVQETLESEFSDERAASSDDADAWKPGRPVRVGETWELASDAVAHMFGRAEVQLTDARSQATLERLDEEDGRTWATVVVTLSGRATQLGRLPLRTAAPTRMELRSRVPLDGASADEDRVIDRAIETDGALGTIKNRIVRSRRVERR